MKILLANRTLSLLAGSETWTYTLAVALKSKGHDVFCYTTELGIISEKLEAEGIQCFDKLDHVTEPFSPILKESIPKDFDVMIVNHYMMVDAVRKVFPDTPLISTIHGIMHTMTGPTGEEIWAPEHPAQNSKVDKYVAVSDEVQAFLKQAYEIESDIVRNSVDIKLFSKKSSKIKNPPKQILVNSNYSLADDPDIQIVKEVAKHFEARLIAIGQNFTQTFDLEKHIRKSDIVVGMGRSVLEGMAAGKLAIVHGRWGTGGVVHEGNIEDIRRFNFSGRNSGGDFLIKDEMIAEIEKHFNSRTLTWQHDYVRANHNIESAADQYLSIIEEILKPKVVSELRPYKRAES